MTAMRMKKESMTVSFGIDGCLTGAIKEALILSLEQDIKVNFRYGNCEYSIVPSIILNEIEESGRPKS